MQGKQGGFQEVCIASCQSKRDGFNCYRQKCIPGTSSLILEWHQWLTWLSWHAARVITAEVLISQKRENSLCCFQKSFSARSCACCVLWEWDTMEDYSPARLDPDFGNNSKVYFYILRSFTVSLEMMIRGYCSPIYDRIAEVFLSPMGPTLLSCYAEIDFVYLNLSKFSGILSTIFFVFSFVPT